jgi:endonuclease YncB( thermonuclease family)
MRGYDCARFARYTLRARRSLLVWLIVIAVGAAVTHGVREYQRAQRGAPWVATPAGATLTGRARAIDGDSLELAGLQIRLFGIDAPEGRQDCRDRAGETYPCGREAARALAAAIAGRAVTCTAVDHDRYDRDVAICTVGTRDLGELMVRAGLAIDLPQHSRGRYAAAEREARDAKRGLWGGTFEQPAAWRRRAGG